MAKIEYVTGHERSERKAALIDKLRGTTFVTCGLCGKTFSIESEYAEDWDSRPLNKSLCRECYNDDGNADLFPTGYEV